MLSSYDVLNGSHNNTLLYATERWAKSNPKLLQAVFNAVTDAADWINASPRAAAEFFKTATKSNLAGSDIEAIIKNPRLTDFAPEPKETIKFAAFFHASGRIKSDPVSWQNYFWSVAHQLKGS